VDLRRNLEILGSEDLRILGFGRIEEGKSSNPKILRS
jgi:hypothetical protein